MEFLQTRRRCYNGKVFPLAANKPIIKYATFQYFIPIELNRTKCRARGGVESSGMRSSGVERR